MPPTASTRPAGAVSVVLATFQGERFVREQVDSLLAQTSPPAELVVADDGSSDRTADVVRDAARHAPFPVRIRVNERRKGYRRNFLDAAALATAPLVAFCDQDDVWDPGKLATVSAAFDRPDVLLAYHNARIVDAAGERSGRLYGPEGARARNESARADPWSFSLGFTQTFRRELLDLAPLQAASRDFLFPEERLAHDQWFFFLASTLGGIRFIDEDLADHRQHDANVFGADGRGRARRLRAVRATLDRSPGQLAGRAAALRAQAGVLGAIAGDPAQRTEWRDAARSASAHYLDLAALYGRRTRTYGRAHAGKARAWAGLLAGRSAVRDAGLSYPARHAVRDLVFGVVLGGLARP